MAKTRGRYEGSVFQRSDGRWVAEISVGHKPNGKRDKRSSYHKTKLEATKALSKLRNAQETGMLGNAQNRTLEVYLNEWLALKKPSLKPSTVATYQDFIKRLVVPALGKVKLEKLTAFHLDQLYRSLSERYAPRTPRVVHSFLHGALKQAERWGYVTRNVSDAATPPKAVRSEMKVWTPDEVLRFLAVSKPYRLHALFYVALTRARRQVTLITVQGQESPFVTELLKDNRVTIIRAPGPAPEPCPTCGKGLLIERSGKYGPFVGCSAFPRCRHTGKIKAPNAGTVPQDGHWTESPRF